MNQSIALTNQIARMNQAITSCVHRKLKLKIRGRVPSPAHNYRYPGSPTQTTHATSGRPGHRNKAVRALATTEPHPRRGQHEATYTPPGYTPLGLSNLTSSPWYTTMLLCKWCAQIQFAGQSVRATLQHSTIYDCRISMHTQIRTRLCISREISQLSKICPLPL